MIKKNINSPQEVSKSTTDKVLEFWKCLIFPNFIDSMGTSLWSLINKYKL